MRHPTRIVLAAVVTAAALAGGALTGCSDAPAEVERQLCDEQVLAGATFARLVEGGDLTSAGGAIPELRGRLDQMRTLATELTEADEAAVAPTLEAARVDVAALAGMQSAGELRAALDAMATAYGPTLGALRTGLDCP